MQKKTKMQKKGKKNFSNSKNIYAKKGRKYYFKKTGKKKAEMQKKKVAKKGTCGVQRTFYLFQFLIINWELNFLLNVDLCDNTIGINATTWLATKANQIDDCGDAIDVYMSVIKTVL